MSTVVWLVGLVSVLATSIGGVVVALQRSRYPTIVEIYSRLAFTESQARYDQAIGRFPV